MISSPVRDVIRAVCSTLAVVCALGCAAAARGSGSVSEFTLPHGNSLPYGIAEGPDGNVWFTEQIGNRIGRVTTSGVITEFELPQPESQPKGIAAGPDGALWFAESRGDRIGRIQTDGKISEFSVGLSAGGHPGALASIGGSLWFTEEDARKIGRITTAGRITQFPLPGTGLVSNIARGTDGQAWFTESQSGRIGRIDIATLVTSEFSTGLNVHALPDGIVAGPDGAMWFADLVGSIGRIDLRDHRIKEFMPANPDDVRSPAGVASGSDGNVWFADFNGDDIGRVDAKGKITVFSSGISPYSSPEEIVEGADGAMWFTEYNGNRIGRFQR